MAKRGKDYTQDIVRIYDRYFVPTVRGEKTVQQTLEKVFPKGFKLEGRLLEYASSREPVQKERAATPKMREAQKIRMSKNVSKLRESIGKVPKGIRQKVEKLPFAIRDVKVLKRTTKFGLKGDVTFRGSDGKTYAIRKEGKKK